MPNRRQKFERTVKFYKVEGQDTREGPSEELIGSAKGIVSIGAQGLDPDYVTVVTDSTVRCFFKNNYRAVLSEVAIGDELELDGVGRYEVNAVDIRGVLPGKYPNRIEGVMS